MESGFNAIGQEVPSNRLVNGYDCIKTMLPNVKNEQAFTIISKCARYIRKDKPFEIVGAVAGLDKDLALIDLTGRYRLLSVLLTGGQE